LGHFGQATVFSFHPRKSISTGEGGVVVTRDDRIADQIEMLRNHGQQLIEGKREFVGCGFNYRLTEIQAAIGLVQLEKLQPIIEKKRRLVSIYLKELASVHGLQLPAAPEEHTWQTFMVTLESQQLREQLMQSCLDEGIQTGPGSVAGHTGLAWGRGFVEPKDLCPVSTRLANCGLALPLHPLLEEQDVRRVAGVVRRILEQLSAKPNSRRGAQ
jgi:dTDP-4-amino-4,6-dideoxygalactose transaminase